jgi:hypothetical protein
VRSTSRKAGTPPHPARFCAGEKSRVRSATGRHVFIAAPTSSSGRPEENAQGAYRPAALRYGVLPIRLQDRASETRRTSFEVPSAPLGHRDFETQAFLPAHRGSPFQPSKAARRSARGRLPKASPGHGCEPDRRRRPFPATRTPLDAPSMETVRGI